MRCGTKMVLVALWFCLSFLPELSRANGQSQVVDPGLRRAASGAGAPLPGLTPSQLTAFLAGQAEFQQARSPGAKATETKAMAEGVSVKPAMEAAVTSKSSVAPGWAR